jgi:hypothetical protein
MLNKALLSEIIENTDIFYYDDLNALFRIKDYCPATPQHKEKEMSNNSNKSDSNNDNDSSINFDSNFIKNFFNDKSELETPVKIKAGRGKRLKYRLYAYEAEIDVVKTLGFQGILFGATGYISSYFDFGILLPLVFFVFGGVLVFISLWSLLWKIFYGVNYLHSFEIGEHPVILDQPTPIALSIKKCVGLEKITIKLECDVYDARDDTEYDEHSTNEGKEKVMFRQILFSEEQIQFQDNIFWISNLSIKPTCLYSTQSRKKKVFWYIIVEMQIDGRNRCCCVPFLVCPSPTEQDDV